jgi:hypothetical protein
MNSCNFSGSHLFITSSLLDWLRDSAALFVFSFTLIETEIGECASELLIDDDDPSTEGIDIVNSVCFLDMHIACHMKETAEIKPEISLVNYYWIFVNQMIFSF